MNLQKSGYVLCNTENSLTYMFAKVNAYASNWKSFYENHMLENTRLANSILDALHTDSDHVLSPFLFFPLSFFRDKMSHGRVNRANLCAIG